MLTMRAKRNLNEVQGGRTHTHTSAHTHNLAHALDACQEELKGVQELLRHKALALNQTHTHTRTHTSQTAAHLKQIRQQN